MISSARRTGRAAAIGAGLGLALFAGSAHTQVTLETDDQKALYAIGLMIGQQLGELDLSEDDLAYVYEGLQDRAQGNEPRIDSDEQMAVLNNFVSQRMGQRAEQTKARGQAFLEDFIEEGGTLTDSGMAYRIVEPGDGDKPSPEDTVEVHYEGSLVDGTVFDSSYTRDETATFPLDQVIAGWTEGLQLIAPGGTIHLVIPSDLAYGDQGAPPDIPGGATLIFEVELIDIK